MDRCRMRSVDIQSDWYGVREIGGNERKYCGESLCSRWPSSVQGHVEELFMVRSNECCISMAVRRFQWRYL